MVITRNMEKENSVQGVRRAKAAPDFSKLHKQWDAKLQKGKAVKKKPLTEVQPFDLTKGPPATKSSSSSCSDDDFITSSAAKENLFENSNNISTQQSKRATIGVIRRSPAVQRSAIPRPSFCVPRRNTLNVKQKQKAIVSPTTPKFSNIGTPKRSAAGSVVKKARDIQGFTVDFKTDTAALDSILNCEGIEHLPKTPSKLSSQFGPSKKGRVNSKQNRAAPFAPRASMVCRSKKVEEQQQNRLSLNAPKQRWSIYSRESYSSKPNLKDWLQGLIDESKAKKLAAKQKEREQEKTAKEDETKNTSSTNGVSSKIQPTSRDSFIFRKTLVGYQGNGTKAAANEKCASTSVAESVIIEEPEVPSTPIRPLPIVAKESSTIKSILKKSAVMHKIDHSKPNAAKSLKLQVGTPVRFTAHALQQLKLGLPLPKENRYESGSRKVGKKETTSKSVKWADEGVLPENEDTALLNEKSPLKIVSPLLLSVSPPQSPELQPLPSTPTLNSSSSGRNTSQRHSPIMTRSRAHGKSPLPAPVPTVSSTSSPSPVHQFKYVMPSEQPTEKSFKIRPPVRSIIDETYPPATDKLHPIKSCVESKKEEVPTKKSWAQVLEEQLDPYAKTSPDESDKLNTTAKSKKKKKKKRNINRCSILERIYGQDIYLKDDDDDDGEEECDDTTSTSTSDVSRPMPSIDEKLIGDLMSFNDEQNNDMDLEEPSFFSFARKIEEQHKRQANQDNPFQSTLLRTPPLESQSDETVELIELTPVLETSSRLPEAPKRQYTKARTPYKQAMLDILHRTLAEAKKRREQEGVLDCTVLPLEDNTTIHVDEDETDVTAVEEKLSSLEGKPVNLISLSGKVQDHTLTQELDAQTGIDNTMTSFNERFAATSINVPNLNSPSMRLFSNSIPDSTMMTTTQQSIVLESNFSKQTVQSKVTYASPKHSSTTAVVTSNQNFLKPASFTINHRTSPRVSEKVSGFSSAVNNAKLLPSLPVPLVMSNQFPVPPLFTGMTQDSKPTQRNEQGKRRRSAFGSVGLPTPSIFSSQLNTTDDSKDKQTHSVQTATCQPPSVKPLDNLPVFPSAPLFSSLSHGVKFSSNTIPTFQQQQQQQQHSSNILRPTQFVSQHRSDSTFVDQQQRSFNQQNVSRLNETTFYNESTLLDDSDICMVFKPANSQRNTNIESNPPLLKPSAFSFGTGGGGAFRPMKPPTVHPRSDMLTAEEVSLNTEVEVYTKIGELYRNTLVAGRNLEKQMKRRDGTFNVVAKLLEHGDSQHFVPINEW